VDWPHAWKRTAGLCGLVEGQLRFDDSIAAKIKEELKQPRLLVRLYSAPVKSSLAISPHQFQPIVRVNLSAYRCLFALNTA